MFRDSPLTPLFSSPETGETDDTDDEEYEEPDRQLQPEEQQQLDEQHEKEDQRELRSLPLPPVEVLECGNLLEVLKRDEEENEDENEVPEAVEAQGTNALEPPDVGGRSCVPPAPSLARGSAAGSSFSSLFSPFNLSSTPDPRLRLWDNDAKEVPSFRSFSSP